MEGEGWLPRSVCKRWSQAGLVYSILMALCALAGNVHFLSFAETEPRNIGVLSESVLLRGQDEQTEAGGMITARGWRRDSYSIK